MAESNPRVRRENLLVPGVFESVAERFTRAHAQHPALTRLLHEAEVALEVTPPSVLDKQHTPPSGDKRDYFSLSIYFWPDPEKPDGLPYIPRDGVVNPETQEYDRPAFESMVYHVDTLTFAYAVTGDERYAEKAATFFRTWFLDERTSMHPNMLFAQYVPGDNVVMPWKDYPARFVPGTDGRKGVYVSFGGVIEDLDLVPLTDCIRLLRRSRHWSDADDAGIRKWYAAYTHWLQTHQHGLDEAACRNNHGSWYWADIACFLELIGRPDEARKCIETVLPDRLRLQIEPDGSQPEELVRAISKSYTSFTLSSFANLAVSAGQSGYDAWAVETEDGRSIRKAVDWFLPYATEDQPWTWRQIKPFRDAAVIPVLAAAAQRFPDGPYADAMRRVPGLDADHRYRLLYDLM